MVWQDIAVSVANVIFGYALIPQIYQGFKKKKGFITLQTALLTTICLCILTITFFTLGFYISTTIVGVNGMLWFILLLQRLVYGKV